MIKTSIANPEFSIITCTWNSEQYLPQCIASLQAQSFKNFEQIFVDGGSTDNTLSIIERATHNYRIVHDVRGGVANAMNEGIKASKGNIIAHLHSDDYYLSSQTLELVNSFFERTPHSWAYGKVKYDDNGKHQEPTWQPPEPTFKNILRRNFIPHPATFIKRSIFNKHGLFDPSLRFAMDYDLWLRISKEELPAYIDEWIAVFRRHSQSLSTANPAKTLLEDYCVRKRYLPKSNIVRLEHWARYIKRYIETCLSNPQKK